MIEPAYRLGNVPALAGISGGRTSGLMAFRLDPRVVLTFQNTGREHPRTYDFLHELEGALKRQIVWLEFRMPKVKGTAPKDFPFAIVDYHTASRDGAPFAGFLEACADYRRIVKGAGPIAPWARQRICTAYMKQKVQERYARSLGIDDGYDSFVGLRADEPSRVSGLLARETSRKSFRVPLSDTGVTKADVGEFWSRQSFDLRIEPHQGNCTGCFLKDESDLSRVMGEEETDPEWWFAIEEKYPGFGGRSHFPGYRKLAGERKARLSIERSLRVGIEPGVGINGEAAYNLKQDDPRRFRLVVLQEKRRIAGETPQFSCSPETCSPSEGELDDSV